MLFHYSKSSSCWAGKKSLGADMLCTLTQWPIIMTQRVNVEEAHCHSSIVRILQILHLCVKMAKVSNMLLY